MFYGFYTNNVGKKEFIETIELKNPLSQDSVCDAFYDPPSMTFYGFYTNNVGEKTS